MVLLIHIFIWFKILNGVINVPIDFTMLCDVFNFFKGFYFLFMLVYDNLSNFKILGMVSDKKYYVG